MIEDSIGMKNIIPVPNCKTISSISPAALNCFQIV